MFHKIIRLLLDIANREYIPKLPRGMLAIEYDENKVTRNQWRVLDRIGARDVSGIQRALRIYGVDTIPELVDLLEHHQPKRSIRKRLYDAFGRFMGGERYDPHAQEVRTAWRQYKQDLQHIKIKNRVKRTRQYYDG